MITALCLWIACTSGATELIPARSFEDGFTPPAAGVYHLYALCSRDAVATLAVGESQLTAAEGAAVKTEYSWQPLGSLTLDTVTYPVRAGDGVIFFAASTEAGYSPDSAELDRRVFRGADHADDARARRAHHTDSVFTMPAYDSRAAWEETAAVLRTRFELSSGLWPAPEPTPLEPEIFDETDHGDYTVAKVRFAVRPGFYATGNLFRPKGAGPFPAVVSPHGHWEAGRLEHSERASVPARGITLARMGIVTFTYDMIGYTDSQQFPHGWGSYADKLWGLHPFGLQLWTSLRAVDFVLGLPGVDPARIGVTGASGGGTQSFALTAIDPRIAVAAPVNMISSTMQGGCGCENAPLIRLGHSNMEVGALAVPRPLLMVSATGDWTRETPRVEYPAIRSVYALYDAADRVSNAHIDAPHNYNQASREAMYRFMAEYLLGDPAKALVPEPPVQVDIESLRIAPKQEKEPRRDDYELILEGFKQAQRARLEAELPQDAAAAPAFQARFGERLRLALGVEVPQANDLSAERMDMQARDGYVVEHWVLGRRGVGDAIPAIFYRNDAPQPQPAALLVHGAGKAALAGDAGPGAEVRALMTQGYAVLAIDAFLLGEHHSPFAETKRYAPGRFMDTFEPTDTGCRIQDVVTAAAWLRSRRDLAGPPRVFGYGNGGVWSLFAAACDRGIGGVYADVRGFDPTNDRAWVDENYLACIRALGDVRTAQALVVPRPLVLVHDASFPAALATHALAVPPTTDEALAWLQ